MVNSDAATLPLAAPPWCSQPAWQCVAVCAGLFALSVALRFIGLADQPLWLDEIHTYIASTDLPGNLLRWETLHQQYHSPLPYMMAKVSRALLGDGPFGVRALLTLQGAMVAPLAYLVFAFVMDRRMALFAGVLLALYPVAVGHAREARMYAPWLMVTIIAVMLVVVAERDTRQKSASPLNWRWFALGLSWMWLHATALHSLTTVLAMGVWLVIAAVACLPRWRDTLRLLVGIAVASATFLGSWSLTGIGKLLNYMGSTHEAATSSDASPSNLLAQVAELAQSLTASHVVVSVAVLLLAVAGLVVAASKGHWRLAVLLVLIALAPLLLVAKASAVMAFYPRYMHVAVLTICVGLAALLAQLSRAGNIGRSVAVCVSAGLLATWVMPLWTLMTTPRMDLPVALAPMQHHAQPGDVAFAIPRYASEVTAYYKVDTPWLDATAPRDLSTGAVWLFVFDPASHESAIDSVLAQLGLPPVNDQAALRSAITSSTMTLTCRVSAAGVEHVVHTQRRSFNP